MATGCCVFVGVGVAITQWSSTPASRHSGHSIGARARRSGLGCSMRLCAGGSWPARGVGAPQMRWALSGWCDGALLAPLLIRGRPEYGRKTPLGRCRRDGSNAFPHE